MARNQLLIGAPRTKVFEVLADPRSYAYWVVGSREVRAADPAWPAVGTTFQHTVNIGPLRVKDSTSVEKAEPGRHLQLKARARPFGNARDIALDHAAGGTRVIMVEDGAGAASAFLFQPLTHFLVRRRNSRALARLAELAEGRVAPPGEESQAAVRSPGEAGAVINPLLHGQPELRRRRALTVARGALAGVAGARAADVGDATLMQEAVREAAARLGGLDAVITAAGAGAYGPFADMAIEDCERTVRVSLLGILNTARAALPDLTRSGGTLVAVGSVAGRVPTPWLSAYAAAKHGVRGFVRSLDSELRALGSPVRVALVAPGPVDTPFRRRARTTDRRAARVWPASTPPTTWPARWKGRCCGPGPSASWAA